MLLYVQAWLPLVTIALTAAISFAVASSSWVNLNASRRLRSFFGIRSGKKRAAVSSSGPASS